MSTKRRNYVIAGSGGVAAFLLVSRFGMIFFPGCGKTGEDLAVYEIKEAGGRIEVDESAPDKPVVRVDFDGFKKTGLTTFAPLGDDGLAHLRPYLESLPRLRSVRIPSMAMISDAGLKHLEGLTQLETLELYGNWLGGSTITESGVDQLRKKLPKVKINYFNSGPPPPNVGTLPRP